MANIIHQFLHTNIFKALQAEILKKTNEISSFGWNLTSREDIFEICLSVFAKGMWTNVTEINWGGVGSFIKLNLRLELSLYGAH